MARFKINARGFGAWTNGITFAIAAAAEADSSLPTGVATYFTPWVATVRFPAERKVFTHSVRGGLLVRADGTGSLVVDHATKLVSLEDGEDTLAEFSFEAVPTLRDLASAINGVTGWAATVVGQGYWPVAVLNNGTTAIVATDRFVPAEEGLLAHLLNSSNPLVTMELDQAPAWGALAAVAEANLAGGAGRGTDTVASDDLTPALALASTVEAHALFIQSATDDLQFLALAHCAEMSEADERRYRIFFAGINFTGTSPVDGADAAGATLDDAIAAAVARAQALDGPAVLCFNGPSAPSPISGQPEQLGGLGLAAQVLGMWAGGRVKDPLTNKAVISQGLEFPSLTRSQIETLLDGGVLFPAFDNATGRTRIIQALTTFQSSNPAYRNLQGLTIQHEVARLWIRVLSRYVGAPLDLETGERIKADCAKALDGAIVTGTNPDGFLTQGRLADGTPLPAWEGLQVVGDSTLGLWDIEVNAHPVGETDYIRVRTKLTPVPIEL